jgi:XTP/dITP diphosphohydrolase
MTIASRIASGPLVLATGNPGKVAEFNALFDGLRFAPQSDWDVPECAEPAASFVENALAKARHAASHTGMAALADDSGLCVAALGGAPGVRSARYARLDGKALPRAAQDAANNAQLLEALHGVADRQAHFVCVLVALREPQDPEPLIAHGWLHGRIAEAAAGEGGFGYDPLFVLSDGSATLAQLDAARKNALSHRARAAGQMRQLLQAFWGLRARES